MRSILLPTRRSFHTHTRSSHKAQAANGGTTSPRPLCPMTAPHTITPARVVPNALPTITACSGRIPRLSVATQIISSWETLLTEKMVVRVSLSAVGILQSCAQWDLESRQKTGKESFMRVAWKLPGSLRRRGRMCDESISEADMSLEPCIGRRCGCLSQRSCTAF